MGRTAKHPGTIDKPGASWRWRVLIDGDRKHYLLPRDGDDDVPPDPSKADVAAFARREYDRLKKESQRGKSRVLTVTELLKEFEERFIPTLAASSQRTYKDSLRPIRVFFKNRNDPRLRHISRADISAYLDWRRVHDPYGERREKPLSKWTIQKERAVLHRAFAKAHEWGYVDSNPVSQTERPKPDSRDAVILDEDEYSRLVSEAYETGQMLGFYALLLGETGMRCESEALWLRWEDVDLDDGFLRVVSGRDGHRTKGGTGRDIPLTPRLEQAFRNHAAKFRMTTYGSGKRSPWVFHHTIPNRGAKPGDRIVSMRRGLTSAAERAELPERWRPHDLRHRRVTTWLAKGRSPVKVKEAVGHADLDTTMQYYSYAREHLRSLVENQEGVDLEKKLDRVMDMLTRVVDQDEETEASSAAG